MEVKQEKILKNIQKAKLGDQVAFTFLLDFYWNEVYGYMLKRTENETNTEDIVIETFAKAFDKISTYNPEFGFNTWLIAIAKNAHIDLLRKKKSTLFLEITNEEDGLANQVLDSTPTIEDKLITEQNLSQLLLQIKQLKPVIYNLIDKSICFESLNYHYSLISIIYKRDHYLKTGYITVLLYYLHLKREDLI